jgi:16S rRNA G1207 methylase RsmC
VQGSVTAHKKKSLGPTLSPEKIPYQEGPCQPRRDSILVCRVTPSPADLSRFVNKTVGLRFFGRDLSFQLSHALFSSFDIDAGTRLLLKSLAARIDFGSLRSVLDIGCGVGVIGACICSRAPKAKISMQDRDALAAAFALENCRANGMEHASISCGLAFRGLESDEYDLVAANLPAKAGLPVLRSLLRHAAGILSPGGTTAVVIVAPLAPFVRESLAGIGCDVVHEEATTGYTVFHFRAGPARRETAAQREDLLPYIRTASRFVSPGFSYSLQTAHSLPDFDTLGYAIELALDVLREAAISGRILAWNPGQGHLPVGLVSKTGKEISSVALASRDALQCEITALNLSSSGRAPETVRPLCSEAELAAAFPEGGFDAVIAAPQPIPRVPWQAELASVSAGLLKPRGVLLVVGTSTDMHRFLDQRHGLILQVSRKHAGFRAVLLRKP